MKLFLDDQLSDAVTIAAQTGTLQLLKCQICGNHLKFSQKKSNEFSPPPKVINSNMNLNTSFLEKRKY